MARELAALLVALCLAGHALGDGGGPVDIGESSGEVEPLKDIGEGADPGAPVPSNDKDSTVTQSMVDQKKRAVFLKPPGCRPANADKLVEYDSARTKCAKTKPAPSAFTTPPTQTPIQVTLTNVRITSIMDKKKQFVVEMTRSFRWPDAEAAKMDPALLWNPSRSFSFPDAVSVALMKPRTTQRDGIYLVMEEQLRVTLANSWDYKQFPFDSHTLMVKMNSNSLSSVLEPVSLTMDPVTLPDDLFGFSPKTRLDRAIVLGQGLGPQGVWGKTQSIQLSAKLTRSPTHDIFKTLLPVTLCAAVTYGAFFLRIAQLMPRLISAMMALLMVFLFMGMVSTSFGPSNTGLVWLEYWLGIQSILIGLGCCHHLVCHYLDVHHGESKYIHMDTAMRWMFPITFILSFVWATSIVSWGKVGAAVVGISAPVCVLVFALIYMVLERKASRVEEKTYYPGI